MTELPDSVKRAWESLPATDLPQSTVTAADFAKHLDYTPGAVVGQDRLSVENRQDDVVGLRHPLSAMQTDRVFFYAGLVYGYCRVDHSVTERYRAMTGKPLDSQIHVFDHPLVEIAGFPDFGKTRVAATLQSVGVAGSGDFFDFVKSQIIIDRSRRRVWKIGTRIVKMPDPVLLDLKEPAPGVDVLVFTPISQNGEFVPATATSMWAATPTISFQERKNNDLIELVRNAFGNDVVV